MVFAITLAGLHLMALAVAGADPVVGRSVFALCQAALGAVVLVYGPTRRAAFAVLSHYWIAALAFGALLLLAAWQAGMFGAPHGALNPFAAQTEVWSLAALFFAVLAPAAAAGASGRRPLFEAFLIACLAFAALDIGRKLQAGPEQTLLATAQETAEIYALAALFAAFAAYDSVRSPPRDRAHRRVSMRLMLPGAALGASILGLVLCNAPLALAALLAGLGVMGLGLAIREWPRRLAFVNGLAGLASIGLAILAFVIFGKAGDPFGVADLHDSFSTAVKGSFGLGSGAEGGPVLTWLVEAGVWGAAALLLAGFMFAARLAFSGDRRKAPSRGLALALGALATSLLAGPGGLSPAGAATLAIIIGMAANYADALRLSQRAARAAKQKQSEPEASAADSPGEDTSAAQPA
ncbi:MAG TPA: hypothetical protein VG735_11875 [Caulobacterales bacterium]|nr:hypothetical protein [Caulobacterales bacterium]